MKKRLCALATALLLLTAAPAGEGSRAAEELSVSARGAALIDAASGRVLWGQNENERLPMASTTKLMTALLALENAELSDTVTASRNASGVPGTSIYLSAGETLTMEQALYGLMLRSGNDAAVAIAEHVSGSVEDFAEAMNRRARELNADANFVNPHGLDAEGHEASALALCRILREALKNPDFRVITATREKVIPWAGNDFSRVLRNKNRLLTTYEGATGGKTGFTARAGRCLAFSAERAELELVGAVLFCPGWFDAAEAMLDYGFARYRLETPLAAGETACETAVSGGMEKTVAAVAETALAAAVSAGERRRVEYDFGGGVRAPVRAGEIIGTATLYIGDEAVAETALLAARTVEKREFFGALRRVLRRWALQFAA